MFCVCVCVCVCVCGGGGGSKSAKGGPNPLADMDRGGPNPLADLDRGVQIRGGSKSAVTRGIYVTAGLFKR